MDNIKVSELKDVIKTIVRESISERAQVREVSPPGKKAERMIHHVKASLRKSHPDWDEEKIKSVAIATGWKAHNKGSVEEACDCGKEGCDCKKDKGEQIPKGALSKLNPKIADKGEKGKMQLPPKVKEAGLTSEEGEVEVGDDIDDETTDETVSDHIAALLQAVFFSAKTKNLPNKQKIALVKKIIDQGLDSPELKEASYKQVSPNETDTAAEDKARTIQTDPKVNEASYKVVSPNETDTAKEDKARKIQTEPKVNETAYKTQGPSLKTFDDSPQFPKAVNDPENA